LQIHVDFSRPVTLAEVRHWGPTQMWHDLATGHKVLWGDKTVIAGNVPARVWESPSRDQGLRLMLNRGAGLLWALMIEEGAVEAPDDDFVRRNHHKCGLAIGHALLLTFGQYVAEFEAERLARFKRLPLAPSLKQMALAAYSDGIRFKAAPDSLPETPTRTQLLELAEVWAETLLQIEYRRHSHRWLDIDRYVAWTGIREQAANGLWHYLPNIARNLRLGRVAARHPRERLYRDLPKLLAQTFTTRDGEEFLRVWRAVN
jgi:hypothetical protein